MDIATELKKLAVRLTDAEDPSSVEGQSICDVLKALGGNLSTDASGKLLVKEYQEPSPGGANLLSEPFTLTEASSRYMSDKVVAGASAGNAIVKFTIDGGAEQTAAGVIIEANGMLALVNNPEEQAGITLVEDAAGASKGTIMFMGYLNTQDLETLGNGAIFAAMFNGSFDGSAHRITINAIEKA